MKSFLAPILALALAACTPVVKESKPAPNIFPGNETGEETTEYAYPDLEIPVGFYIDTLSIYDSVDAAEYRSYFLQSSFPGTEQFNAAIREAMQARMDWEGLYVDPYRGESPLFPVFSYGLRPTETFINSKVLSFTHVVDCYGEGGNHHNYSWFTFNYDLEKQQEIRFEDVFPLHGSKDSIDFVDFVYRHALEDCMDGGWSPGTVDFSFTAEGIYINPELSWACGMNRSLLPKDSLAETAREMLRKR